jgi:hypothetical protein
LGVLEAAEADSRAQLEKEISEINALRRQLEGFLDKESKSHEEMESVAKRVQVSA